MLKALAQQERQATRSRHRDAHAGPRDDLDIEMEGLLAKQQRSHPEYVHAWDYPAVVAILAHPLPDTRTSTWADALIMLVALLLAGCASSATVYVWCGICQAWCAASKKQP